MEKGEDFTVPLSAAAVALWERMLPLRNAEHGDFVFPSTKRGKPLSENTMTAVILRMGVDPKIATVHCFRATLRTWA